MKKLLRSLARRCGVDFLRYQDDAVLRTLLDVHGELRLCPDDLLRWDHVLARVASFGHLRGQLQRHAVDLVIDVGANRGQFAKDVRRAGYAGEILSFEPQSAHRRQLEHAASEDGRWLVIGCGLGAETAELDLNVYRDDTFSSVHCVTAAGRRTFGELVSLDHVERIQLRTLDDVCAERRIDTSRRVLLKTDTQGHDRAVLAGATRVLRHTQVVLTEVTVAPIYDDATRMSDVENLLLPLGFARAGEFPIGYDPRTHALVELDCFFARPLAPLGNMAEPDARLMRRTGC